MDISYLCNFKGLCVLHDLSIIATVLEFEYKPATFFEKFELVTSVILISLGSTWENSKSTYYTTLKLEIFNIQKKNHLPFTLIEILLRFLLSVKIVSAEVALASFSNLFSSSALFSINFFGDNLQVACNFRGSKVTADWDCKDPTDAWDLWRVHHMFSQILNLRNLVFFCLK